MSDIDIFKIRKELGLTQDEFAKLIGKDRRTIINYEQGRKISENQQKLITLIIEQYKDPKNVFKEPGIEYEKIPPAKENNTIALQREILELKDHITTLKQFLDEKTIVCDLYKEEINRLKSSIENDKNKD